MKKGLLSLLALALTVVGCQNYDDQFDELTSQITSLQSTVDGLASVSSAITTLQSTVAGLASTLGAVQTTVNGITNYDDSGIVAQLNAVSSTLADLLTQLNGVATNADLAAISSTLADVQADVRELLEGESTINQDIRIINEATLQYAETLVSTGTDRPNVIVNGDVVINTTNFSAGQVQRTNDVIAKIATILGASTSPVGLSVTTTHSLDFTSLTFIDSDYTISGGVDVGDQALRTISGDLTSDQYGAINYTQITSVGDVSIAVTEKNSITSIDFSNASVGSLKIGEAGVGSHTVDAPAAGSIKTGTASVTNIIGTAATTIIHGNATSDLSSLTISTNAADARIDILATGLNQLTVTGSTTTDLFATSLNGTTTFTMANKIAEAHLTALDHAAGTINATVVDLTDLKYTSGALTIAATDVDLTGFDSTLNAGTATLTLTGKGAVTITQMIADNVAAAAITSLTILEQDKDISFPASYAELATLDVTGKADTSANPSTQDNVVTLSSLASLTSVTLRGAFEEVTSDGNAKMTSFTSAAGSQITSLTIDSAALLNSVDLNHGSILYNEANVVRVIDNAKLTSLDLSDIDKVRTVEVTGNALLASITPPATTLSEAGAPIYVLIGVNTLTGVWTNYTPEIPATETSSAIPAVPAKLQQNTLNNFATWLELHTAHTNIQYSMDSASTSGTTQYANIAALATDVASSALVSGTIDIQKELDFLAAE